MSLIQIYIPSEVAHSCIAELGELAMVQFIDLNPDLNPFQRHYVAQIRRLDAMERQCRFLQAQIESDGIPIQSLENPQTTRARSAQQVDDLEETLERHESRMTEMNASYESLQHRFLQLTELRHVLGESETFFRQAEARDRRQAIDTLDDTAPLLNSTSDISLLDMSSIHLGHVTGVIDRSKVSTFERVLWRSLRGNLLMYSVEIEDMSSERSTEKNVFAIFAHGLQVVNKIRKISEGLGGTLYDVADESDKRRDTIIDVVSRLEDLSTVLTNTEKTRQTELANISKHLAAWTTMVRKEKATFHIMNLLIYDPDRKCMIAEGWCPTTNIHIIKASLRETVAASGTNLSSILTPISTRAAPPTYHRTNRLTLGFQSIIDAYGIARYREVNPGLFTIVTFPFLFAVMFGDIGHGFLLFLFALYLVLNEKKLASNKGEIFSMFFSGRYMMLLMGIFSIFTGIIYNDIFSLSLSLGKSGFDWPSHNGTEPVEAHPNGHVYSFGFDPAWHGSENFLLFSNSYKMKQAIILGVFHMSFAICLNVFNHVYFGKKEFVWLEFLPQILFMESIFGYLVFCILYKWSVNWWEVGQDGLLLRNAPPNLLNMLIYMFLSPGKVDPKEQLYPGQGPLQAVLIFIALICVPWMWFAKPFYLKKQHQKYRYTTVANDENDNTSAEFDHEMAEEEFEFSEMMIHQTIHTIEFCLNCISNTASYLRLWALSLAHAQLSSVLWDMTLKIWFNLTGFWAVVGLVIGFSMWFVLTIGILLGMEGLSAFLHALRLHWVEFDGKFYMGDGYLFEPFSFQAILDSE
ncbi:V-type ATPase, V0 complex, 116kDa subunit family [Phycomyces nitens]|nr:V-type ATPase, V0 complex, 116kDa subunit family [Phycomyces nitens]